jgi:hypothetical protein
MSVGVSLFLIAAGAILRYAVTWNPEDVNIETVGLILMIAGVVGFVAGLAMALGARDRDTYARDRRDPYC